MALIAKPIFHELENEGSIIEYSGKDCSFLEFKDTKYKARFATFKYINFNKLVHFDGTNLAVGIVFENCRFYGPVIFENITANDYDLVLNPDSQKIVFRNCEFYNLCEFKNSRFDGEILFESSQFKHGLDISNLKIDSAGLKIVSCTMSMKLDIFNISAAEDIYLTNNELNAELRIENTNCNKLLITGHNTFNEGTFLNGGLFISGIYFEDGFFEKEIHINQVTSDLEGLLIFGSEFKRSFFVNFHSKTSQPDRGLHSFHFSNAQFHNGIYINGTDGLLSQNPICEKIEIVASAELKGDIVFRNLDVGVVAIAGYNNTANISLEHLFINQLKIKNLINNAGLLFSFIRASHKDWSYPLNGKEIPLSNAVYIDDSSFGKAQFYQVDFSSFDTVAFHNNLLTDISTSLVKWFSPEQLDINPNSHELVIYKEAIKSKNKQRISNATASLISSYRSKQEIYRQLKFSSQKQGDIPQALEFQRHEMNFYRKIVKLRKPRKWNEHLILWSNQSNDFGQNWLKALWLLIGFSFATYLPIGFLTSTKLDYTKFASSFSDILLNMEVLFCDNIKHWGIIINPAHRVSDITGTDGSFSDWIIFWDLLSRIVVSYFIFQLITAFRKFNK